MSPIFDHEKLTVYQTSLAFTARSEELLRKIKTLAVSNQLDRASTSIPLNIAEGNGKFTPPDRCRYFDNARGSALECAASLDVLVAKKRATAQDIESGKEQLRQIVSILVGLIRSNSTDRVHEEAATYEAKRKNEQD